MSSPQQASVSNQLLKCLRPADFSLIAPLLEPVPLEEGAVLITPNERIEFLVLPESGLGSVIAVSPDLNKSEVGLFGRDGLSGIPLLLGLDRMPTECVIQVAGAGHRIAANALREVMNVSQTLRESLLPFVQTLTVQTAR